MNKIKFRKAKVSDSQNIRKLEEKVWKEEVVNKYDIPMFVRFGYAFIAEDKTKLVGAIIGYRTNKNEVYICDLVVDPKYRRLGIGEKLRKKFFEMTRGMNIVSFLDPSNQPVIELNKKMGVKIVSKVKNAYGFSNGNKLEENMRLFVRTRN